MSFENELESNNLTYEQALEMILSNNQAPDELIYPPANMCEALFVVIKPYISDGNVDQETIEQIQLNKSDDIILFKSITKQIFTLVKRLQVTSAETSYLSNDKISQLLEVAFYININCAARIDSFIKSFEDNEAFEKADSFKRMKTHFYAHAATNAGWLANLTNRPVSLKKRKGINNLNVSWKKEQEKYLQFSIQTAEKYGDYTDLVEHYISALKFYEKSLYDFLTLIPEENRLPFQENENVAGKILNWYVTDGIRILNILDEMATDVRTALNNMFGTLDRYELRFKPNEHKLKYGKALEATSDLITSLLQFTYIINNFTVLITHLTDQKREANNSNRKFKYEKQLSDIFQAYVNVMPNFAFTLLQFPIRIDLINLVHGDSLNADSSVSYKSYFDSEEDYWDKWLDLIKHYMYLSTNSAARGPIETEITRLLDQLYFEIHIRYQNEINFDLPTSSRIANGDSEWREVIESFISQHHTIHSYYIFKVKKALKSQSRKVKLQSNGLR